MRAAALVLAVVLAAGCSSEEIARWNREAAVAQVQQEVREAAAHAPRKVVGKYVTTRLLDPDLYYLVASQLTATDPPTYVPVVCSVNPATYATVKEGDVVACGDWGGWRVVVP